MAKRKWSIDPMHSEIKFKVKHLMITNVTGGFDMFKLDVETEDENFMASNVEVTIDANSITTGNAQRDGHLKSADFFDTENHPEIKFVKTKVVPVDNDGSYEVYGDLTIRGNTKNVKFDVEFGGVVQDAYGNTKAGFTVNGKIKRKEFGLHWDAVTEAGGVMVSDEVRIMCELQLIEQR